ncbi:MAG: hypothetical protein AT718_00315 [Vulcanisaeta sp. JCHS_4]|nr:MAG: hypothetical protein AT718_00315 [Vulcanisaeta sp. JCHS_4]
MEIKMDHKDYLKNYLICKFYKDVSINFSVSSTNNLRLSQRTKLERVRDHLDKFLGLYVGLAIIIGLIAGYYDAAWARSHASLL